MLSFRKIALLVAASAPLAWTASPVAAASAKTSPAQHAEALKMWKAMIAIPTVQGRGEMRRMADYVASQLRGAGFAAEDIVIEGQGDAVSLAARYRGTSGGKDKAILLSGHMDVVEARPSDWTRDPFTPVEEGGFVYGRGSLDMKFGDAVLVSTLMQLKREGFKPRRDILLLLSGDEETDMATTARLAERYAGEAELLLNADGGGGQLDETGKPVAFYVQGAEKTYADFEFTITDPGGHSSRPGPTNAIAEVAAIAQRIAAFRFPARTSELTASYMRQAGAKLEGETGAALQRFADNPADSDALQKLRADPEWVGQTGTTCVPTMISGGHALNALPQKASLSVNCRIFPGESVEEIRTTLWKVAANEKAKMVTLGAPLASDASPLRPDLMHAVRKGIDLSYPGLPISGVMAAGATDSLYFRAKGVPSYGVLGMFLRPEDDFAHGLDERAPVASLDPALTLMRTMVVDLSK
ncbi:MAG: M20/M25/M40 family metallo-hydrolase [Rhizorhabdus sp.]|uniref:M20/M25/M40 family metallo-hydrolase n=1 Tax=Rhizorhabdus sp. TaxID=1968843 RepID=UPI001B4A5D5D|nr:M20/M25/M40 family metallo-hydrolase [Rhizorhabdus sp.]MBP8234827.1 M20/M25/M40 family metallo-hydrolase [Rhizorhabdus sp.]